MPDEKPGETPNRSHQIGKITKADIIDALYEKTKFTRTDIHTVVDLVIDEMKKALIKRKVIELRGFGTFEIRIRKARQSARNPKTGESLAVDSHGTVVFRLGRELKQKIRKFNDDDET